MELVYTDTSFIAEQKLRLKTLARASPLLAQLTQCSHTVLLTQCLTGGQETGARSPRDLKKRHPNTGVSSTPSTRRQA